MPGHPETGAAEVLSRNPLPKFMVIVHVRLHKSLADADGAESDIIGYYRPLGVAADRERLRQVVEEAVAEEGRVDWTNTKCREVNIEELAADVRARTIPLEGSGLWYLGGRAYYPSDDA